MLLRICTLWNNVLCRGDDARALEICRKNEASIRAQRRVCFKQLGGEMLAHDLEQEAASDSKRNDTYGMGGSMRPSCPCQPTCSYLSVLPHKLLASSGHEACNVGPFEVRLD